MARPRARGCELGDKACKPGLWHWFSTPTIPTTPTTPITSTTPITPATPTTHQDKGGHHRVWKTKTASKEVVIGPEPHQWFLPFACILGFHTCVGKSRTRGRPDTREVSEQRSQSQASPRPASFLCAAQTTRSRAGGGGRDSSAVGSTAPAEGERADEFTRLHKGWVGWGARVPLRRPGLSVLWAPRGPGPPECVEVGWSPGMARSRLALLLPPLLLLGLVSPTQISPEYQYFGQEGEGDTWELLRQQREKGKLAGGRSGVLKRSPQKPSLTSWLQTDPPALTAQFSTGHALRDWPLFSECVGFLSVSCFVLLNSLLCSFFGHLLIVIDAYIQHCSGVGH